MSDTNQTGASIRAVNAQELLDSASNAADKGAASFYTPIEFGKILSPLLPNTRTTIVDLTSGNGQLLLSAANETTKGLLGVDIDPVNTVKHGGPLTVNKIVGDLTEVWQLLYEIGFKSDLFVLNPPYGLHWKRERLEVLRHSSLPAVRDAFRAGDSVHNKDNIVDSCIATLMIALELSTVRGEGYMIGNHATLEKLLFKEGARYTALAHHIWGYWVLDGNPMTDAKGNRWEEKMQTGIIAFARSHVAGMLPEMRKESREACKDAEELRFRISQVRRESVRLGVQIHSEHNTVQEGRRLFQAAKDEWATRKGIRKSDYNIFLTKTGEIDTYLTLFEQRTVKLDKKELERLDSLKGQRPMNLVMQKDTREALLRAVKGGLWRVDPELPKAVDEAVRKYHSCRAPLYKLNPIMRLGHLDEHDEVTCTKDFVSSTMVKKPYSNVKTVVRETRTIFAAGKAYRIRTKTVKVSRMKVKPNSIGEPEEFFLAGQELAIFIKDEHGHEHLFMDHRHMQPGVDVKDGINPDDPNLKPEFPLEKIAEHFAIPEVPDVAELNPEGFASAKAELVKLESFMNSI